MSFPCRGFAYLALEYFLEHKKYTPYRAFAVFMIIMSFFGFVAIFELAEWFYARFAVPENGSAFLGSQEDVWDAQKEMRCDGLGVITSSLLDCLIKRK